MNDQKFLKNANLKLEWRSMVYTFLFDVMSKLFSASHAFGYGKESEMCLSFSQGVLFVLLKLLLLY